MKKYLLLRDNQESGPFNIDELVLMDLRTMDLIWIEGESTKWDYAGEIEALKAFVHDDEVRIPEKKEHRIFVSLPSNFSRKRKSELSSEYASFPILESEAVLETNYLQPMEELRENYKPVEKKPIWNKSLLPSPHIMNLVGVFMGLILGALLIKKMVEGFDSDEPDQSSVAAVINDIPVPKNLNVHNALATEVVPTDTTGKVLPKLRPLDIRKQVKVKTNDYKVGMFGGIDGLQLTAENNSPHFVDRMDVAIDYLKPNGEVIRTDNISFSLIKAKKVQTISVPHSSRGMKVRCRVLTVYSREFKAALKEA
jgi:hypothetical protein